MQIHNHLVEEAFLNPPDSHEHKFTNKQPFFKGLQQKTLHIVMVEFSQELIIGQQRNAQEEL